MYNHNIIKELSYIILICLTLSLTANYFHPNGLDLLTPYSPKNITQNNTTESTDGPKPIDIHQARNFLGEPDYLFVDARSEADYELCHIANAINFPEHHFEQYMDAFMAQTDPNQSIIAYCGSMDCPLGAHLAEKLYYMGFENVYYLSGGLDAWHDQKFPVQED